MKRARLRRKRWRRSSNLGGKPKARRLSRSTERSDRPSLSASSATLPRSSANTAPPRNPQTLPRRCSRWDWGLERGAAVRRAGEVGGGGLVEGGWVGEAHGGWAVEAHSIVAGEAGAAKGRERDAPTAGSCRPSAGAEVALAGDTTAVGRGSHNLLAHESKAAL